MSRRGVMAWILAAGVLAGGCAAPQEARYWSPGADIRERMAKEPLRAPATAGPATAMQAPVELVAAYDTAVGLVDAGQYARAQEKFAGLAGPLRGAGDLERAGKAWFWMAFCMEKQGQGEAAAAEYGKLMQQHPGSRAAALARGRMEKLGKGPVYKGER